MLSDASRYPLSAAPEFEHRTRGIDLLMIRLVEKVVGSQGMIDRFLTRNPTHHSYRQPQKNRIAATITSVSLDWSGARKIRVLSLLYWVSGDVFARKGSLVHFA